jgi:hypothetical protein
MSTSAAITLGAFLLAALLIVVGIMLFQEAKTRLVVAEPTYVITEAVDHAISTVGPEVLGRIRQAGVHRIIEWSAYYLQGLADKTARRKGITVVAGGEGNAISYIRSQLMRRGHEYTEDDIAAVLATEADYLASIGALGEPANELELA